MKLFGSLGIQIYKTTCFNYSNRISSRDKDYLIIVSGKIGNILSFFDQTLIRFTAIELNLTFIVELLKHLQGLE